MLQLGAQARLPLLLKSLPAHAKITPRWKQTCARELAADGAFHFPEPVIERAFRHAHQRNRAPIVDAMQKINLE